ncbi:MAG TPA: phage tail tube protein [Ramlibacter sp.]|jgi:hypothetical protein
MAISTAAGSKIYIGPVRTDATDTLAEYAALTPWVEIGEVETLGEFGDESAAVTFLSVGDARTRKLKGARDAGTLALTVGRDPLDAGQIALSAAEKTKFEYAFKIVAADAPDEDYTDTTYYFGALVMSARENYGGADNVVRVTYSLGINTEIFSALADETP